MASNEKTRYKAIIADHTYTIIGQESKQHMDLVTKIVNEQQRWHIDCDMARHMSQMVGDTSRTYKH